MIRRLLTALLLAAFAAAAAAGGKPARIAIVIDDLGYSRADGERVLRLPAPVACAILPHTPHAEHIAGAAHRAGREVLLHLPMQPHPTEAAPGPGLIDETMPPLELSITVETDLDAVPHVSGVNNHMGSLLTTRREAMDTLMQALRRRPALFFLDSRTHPQSVAADSARRLGVPTLARDVFLDNDLKNIDREFDRLLQLARRHGSAIAIGHPFPATLEMLERRLPALAAQGVVVVSPSELLSRPEENAHAPRPDTARPRL
jgi:hypothetical protein